MNRQEYTILSITSIAHFLCHTSVLIVTGLLVPLAREFDLNEFWVTVLPLSGYMLMGFGAVPAGMLTDRIGARPVLLLYFVLTGLAAAGAAVSQDAWSFAASLTALGMAASLYHPTGLAYISHGIRSRGRALGIHGVAGSLGLAGSSIGLWMYSLGSWRAAYWFVAATALACVVVFIRLPLRDSVATSGEPTAIAQAPGANRVAVKLLIPLYAATMLSGFNYRSMMTALPTFLTAQADGTYSGTGSGHVVVAVFLAAGLGQYTAGRFADRGNPMRLYVGLAAISVPAALLLAFSAGIGNAGAAAAIALAVVHFGTQPVENMLIATHTPLRVRSTSYGIKFLVTFGIGALGAPAVGYLWHRTGTLAWTFVLFAGVAVVVTGLVLLLARLASRHAAKADVT